MGVTTYDMVTIGVGVFDGQLCEHEWCQPTPRPATVYVEAETGETGFMCARHFGHMVETIAKQHRERQAA